MSATPSRKGAKPRGARARQQRTAAMRQVPPRTPTWVEDPPVELVVFAAPRTKKNSGGVLTRGGKKFHVPSPAYLVFEAEVVAAAARLQLGQLPEGAYNVRATFYRDARRGDAVGYYQALADALQRAGVVANDAQLVAWDGSRLALDRLRPRVEVTVEPLGEATASPHRAAPPREET